MPVLKKCVVLSSSLQIKTQLRLLNNRSCVLICPFFYKDIDVLLFKKYFYQCKKF